MGGWEAQDQGAGKFVSGEEHCACFMHLSGKKKAKSFYAAESEGGKCSGSS